MSGNNNAATPSAVRSAEGTGNANPRNENSTRPRGRRGGRYNRYQSTRGSSTPNFKGKVSEMNGNVFQLATERKKRDQFEDTLEALKIYASTKFSDDITYLDPLFRRLKEPMVNVPVKPGPVTIQNDDGTITVQNPDSVDLDIYKERMKKYDKKFERLQFLRSYCTVSLMNSFAL